MDKMSQFLPFQIFAKGDCFTMTFIYRHEIDIKIIFTFILYVYFFLFEDKPGSDPRYSYLEDEEEPDWQQCEGQQARHCLLSEVRR